jgi:hypothetical protein
MPSFVSFEHPDMLARHVLTVGLKVLVGRPQNDSLPLYFQFLGFYPGHHRRKTLKVKLHHGVEDSAPLRQRALLDRFHKIQNVRERADWDSIILRIGFPRRIALTERPIY